MRFKTTLGALCVLLSTSNQPVVEVPAPTPAELNRLVAVGPHVLLTGEFSATAAVQVDAKRIKIRWAHKPPGYASFIKTTELLATSFYPTAVCRMDNDHVMVAGKSAVTGATVIEAWKLKRPVVKWNPLTNTPDLDLRGTARRIGVYDADVEGRRIVRWIMAYSGTSTRFIAQFSDSGDIYEMTTTGAPPVLIASPDPTAQAPYVPELEHVMDTWWGGTHVDAGNVLTLYDDESGSRVVIIDDDLDYVTDVATSFTTAEFHLMGLDDASKYLDE